MDACTVLIYTHSDYSDIFDISIRRIKKHFSYAKLLVCTNNAQLVRDTYHDVSDVYEYDDTLVYHSKLASALESVTTEYVLLHHDNNCLYSDVSINAMNFFMRCMAEKSIDVLRLSACGVLNQTVSDPNIVTRNEGPHYFSVFPSIWRRSSLLHLCRTLRKPYRECEDDESQEYAGKLCVYYISPTIYDPHRDVSCLYPSAHIIQSGKSCYSQCRWVIDNIVREYDVDLFIRGT